MWRRRASCPVRWWSGQQIQNVGTSTASVSFQAYNSSGTSFSCGNKSVGPGASANFLTIDCAALPAGFVGSAVVSADQPIAAVVNVVNMSTNFDGTGGRAAGLYRGTDGSNVATEIAFPLMKNNFFGRSTALYVQNASDQTNDITVTIRVGASTYTKSFTGVKPYAMVVVGPADTSPAMPNSSYGSAKPSAPARWPAPPWSTRPTSPLATISMPTPPSRPRTSRPRPIAPWPVATPTI